MSVDQYLRKNGIVGIEEIDTRALTRRIRARGAMKGFLYSEESFSGDPVSKARQWPGFDGYDAVGRVTCGAAYHWDRSDGPATDEKGQ